MSEVTSSALNQAEQHKLLKQMSLIRGNRRSVSKQNSLIEPIEESKGEQDIFRNDVGEYIDVVTEEET